MSGSLLTTKVTEALFESKFIDQFGNGQIKQYYNYAASPIINALLYDYLYSSFYKKRYTNTSDNRKRNTNLMLGGVLGFGQSMGDDIIVSWFLNI